MKLQDLFDQLESVSFQANMSIFSGFSTFYYALQKDELVQTLVSHLVASPESAREVFKRFFHILRNNPYPGYAHADDVSLAAYLFVLYQVEPSLAHHVISQVIEAESIWWTRRLAQRIQENESAETRMQEVEITLQLSDIRLSFVTDSGACHKLSLIKRTPYSGANVSVPDTRNTAKEIYAKAI